MCWQKLISKFWNMILKMDTERINNTVYPEDITAFCDIPYIDDGDKYHLLDVYTPTNKKDEKLPLIIDIHGGGYYYGYKEINKLYNYTLSQYGFKVVSGNYRLAPSHTFKDIIQDLYAELDWIVKNADEYNFDLNNVFITGDSAGGTITDLILATNARKELQYLFEVKPKVSFKAAAITCGVPNPGKYLRIYMKPLYGKEYKKSPLFKACNFNNIIPDELPPIFINTCKGDPFHKENIKMYEKIKEKGLTAELYYYGDKKENDTAVGHVYTILTPDLDISNKTTEELINFFKIYVD